MSLLEHPATATSWRMKEVQSLKSRVGVFEVISDMCRFGMKITDKDGTALVKKKTRYLTNSVCLASRLARRCANNGGPGDHRHADLCDGRARLAQVYPDGRCRAIVAGVAAQLRQNDDADCAAHMVTSDSMTTDRKRPWMKRDGSHERFWDDLTGEELDPEEVHRARAMEIEYFRSMGVYTKAPLSECISVTGKRPIDVRWVDVRKKSVGRTVRGSSQKSSIKPIHRSSLQQHHRWSR